MSRTYIVYLSVRTYVRTYVCMYVRMLCMYVCTIIEISMQWPPPWIRLGLLCKLTLYSYNYAPLPAMDAS